MPDFAYIARSLQGQRVEGVLAAATEREVLTALAAKQLYPLQVRASARVAVKPSTRVQGGRVSARLVAPTYSQLAALLRSGVPLLRSLQVIEEQSSHANLRAVLSDVRGRVEEGESLAEAMSRSPRAFDELSVSIIRAGGEGGFLEEALERVAAFTEQQGELRSRIIGALAYPMLLLGMGSLIVTGLMVFIVPNFKELFAKLEEKGELPVVTVGLLAFSEFLQRYGLFVIGAVALAAIAFHRRFNNPAGREMLDRWRLRIPGVSGIYLSLAVARFCRVLGTLLTGGVPIVRSLEIASDSTGNRVLAKAVQEASENITSGQSLAEPLAASGHFPRNVVEMIAVAEQSNSLETVLTRIADTLERETWRRLDLTVRLIEPLLLMLLAGVVLVVVLALLLPVIKMSMTI